MKKKNSIGNVDFRIDNWSIYKPYVTAIEAHTVEAETFEEIKVHGLGYNKDFREIYVKISFFLFQWYDLAMKWRKFKPYQVFCR